MGYVKLKKAGGDFDILSAEGVAKAALDTSTTPGLYQSFLLWRSCS